MNPDRPVLGWLNSLLPALIALLAGGILGEQFYFLLAFFPKYPAHWVVCLILTALAFSASNYLFVAKGYTYSLLSILFFLISFQAFELILKIHEYTHLSYLISYALSVAVGYILSIWKKQWSNSESTFFLQTALFGILGFVWKFYFGNSLFYTLLFLSTIVLQGTFLYAVTKQRAHAIVLLFMIPFFIMWKLNVESSTILENQPKYRDKVVWSAITDQHEVDVTLWNGNHWFYYNGKVQFSTVDEWLYSEAMVHPVMKLSRDKERILVVGGENGILIKELLKYDQVERIDLFVLDSKLYDLASQNTLFTKVNHECLKDKKVNVHFGDFKKFLEHKTGHYNTIIVDVPDPISVQWNNYYTVEFYENCYNSLDSAGIMISQAGSPYFATKAFKSIEKTLQSANFNTLPLHNQVLTLGEWGWILASKDMDTKTMKSNLLDAKQLEVKTKWLNMEAMKMLVSFGKPLVSSDSIEINTSKNRALVGYYKDGNFQFK